MKKVVVRESLRLNFETLYIDVLMKEVVHMW